jgi:hypothetical protein
MRTAYRWILLLMLLAVLAVPAGGVLAQSGSPEDGVIKVQLQETDARLPWFVAPLLFIAVAVGLTVFRVRYQATQKKTIIFTSC